MNCSSTRVTQTKNISAITEIHPGKVSEPTVSRSQDIQDHYAPRTPSASKSPELKQMDRVVDPLKIEMTHSSDSYASDSRIQLATPTKSVRIRDGVLNLPGHLINFDESGQFESPGASSSLARPISPTIYHQTSPSIRVGEKTFSKPGSIGIHSPDLEEKPRSDETHLIPSDSQTALELQEAVFAEIEKQSKCLPSPMRELYDIISF